jgi:methionyl-tRNA synthetase
MDELAFQGALRALWRLLAEANAYLVERAPWKRIKSEGADETLARVLWNGLESVRIVATGLLPFLPEIAPKILAAIGAGAVPVSLDALSWGGLPTSVELPPLDPIFPRIDKEQFMVETTPPPAPTPEAQAPAATAEKPTDLIDIKQFASVQLRVGQVTACEAVPKSEKLLKLTVDLGEAEPRQVLAGIAKSYRPEELVGTQVVVVANLKPAKLMGLESQGMVLAATDPDGQPILLRPHRAGALPGGTVR